MERYRDLSTSTSSGAFHWASSSCVATMHGTRAVELGQPVQLDEVGVEWQVELELEHPPEHHPQPCPTALRERDEVARRCASGGTSRAGGAARSRRCACRALGESRRAMRRCVALISPPMSED